MELTNHLEYLSRDQYSPFREHPEISWMEIKDSSSPWKLVFGTRYFHKCTLKQSKMCSVKFPKQFSLLRLFADQCKTRISPGLVVLSFLNPFLIECKLKYVNSSNWNWILPGLCENAKYFVIMIRRASFFQRTFFSLSEEMI